MAPAGPIGGSPADIQSGYERAYNSAVGQNTALYNSILSGYQNVAASQRTAQDAIAAGYPQLAGRVQGQLGQVAGDLAAAGRGQQYGYDALGGNYLSNAGGAYNDYGAAITPMFDAAGHQLGRNADLIGGYGQLQSDVLGDIRHYGREAQQQINDQYARGSANVRQSAINRGLGNTTVQDTMQRGVEFDRARAQSALEEDIGNINAGYRSQLGQAGLGFQERALGNETAQQNAIAAARARGSDMRFQMAGQAAGIGQAGLGAQERFAQQQAGLGQYGAGMAASLGQAGLGFNERAAGNNTNLALNQLGWMNSVNAPYPNAGQYMQAAQMAGAAEAARNADAQAGLYGANRNAGGLGGGMQMVPGSGRGVPSLGSYGQPAPGFGDAGGGYTGLAPNGQALNAGLGVRQAGGAGVPTIMSTGGMAFTGGYQPQGTTGGAAALTGGTFGGSNRLGGDASQPEVTGSGGGYNPGAGFGGGYGGYGGNNAVDEYGFTEADWANLMGGESAPYNPYADLGPGIDLSGGMYEYGGTG